jgi:hypothetical protein
MSTKGYFSAVGFEPFWVWVQSFPTSLGLNSTKLVSGETYDAFAIKNFPILTQISCYTSPRLIVGIKLCEVRNGFQITFIAYFSDSFAKNNNAIEGAREKPLLQWTNTFLADIW